MFESNSHHDPAPATAPPAVAEPIAPAWRPTEIRSWQEIRRARAAEQRRVDQELAVRLKAEGWTNSQIAHRLGASIGHVETLRREAGDTDPARVAPIDPQVRVDRARQALTLQRAGLTRRAIAEQMGCSIEGVKAMLSDGRFHEEPSGYPERLRRTQEYAELTDAGLDRTAATRRMGLTDAVGRSVFLDVQALALLRDTADA